MHSWPVPHIDSVPGAPSPLHLYDSADEEVKKLNIEGETATMYVCGITPYDSTHLGHAATYLTFDLIYRQLLDNGYKVNYAQNITDVDDPLFERAERDGVDWRELGTSQINLFRSDMELLSVFPPQHFVGAMEAIDEITEMVQALLDAGAAYVVDDPDYPDVYASIEATKNFGYESNYSREQMETFFAERGGDPDRPGKRDPLDALIWRAHREGEPAWESPFGPGRPGWHIECSAIATNRLGSSFDIQGGGSDLKFPHHEFSAAHAEAARGVKRMAQSYVHTGMIGLEGTKMSKSLGNLVFVHKLVEAALIPLRFALEYSPATTVRTGTGPTRSCAPRRSVWSAGARPPEPQAPWKRSRTLSTTCAKRWQTMWIPRALLRFLISGLRMPQGQRKRPKKHLTFCALQLIPCWACASRKLQA